MKLPNPFEVVKGAASGSGSKPLIRALQIGAGAASAIWIALRLRRELYGPGGTRLNRYSPSEEIAAFEKERRAIRAKKLEQRKGG
ncbi:MAG: hypothetical protein H0T48_16660 [Gemmatimonadaceae bacterium]|nr:hypothetical protein [Gemmatimonadaceae bacterium]